MEEVLEAGPVPEQAHEEPPAADDGLSVLQRLARRRAELAEGAHLDLEVSAEPKVMVRYGPIRGALFSRMVMATSPASQMAADAVAKLHREVVESSCRDVMLREEPGAEPEPIADGPTRFDARLAELMGVDVGASANGRRRRPEDVLIETLIGGEADIASHALAVFLWSARTNAELDDDAAGESWGRPS